MSRAEKNQYTIVLTAGYSWIRPMSAYLYEFYLDMQQRKSGRVFYVLQHAF